MHLRYVEPKGVVTTLGKLHGHAGQLRVFVRRPQSVPTAGLHKTAVSIDVEALLAVPSVGPGRPHVRCRRRESLLRRKNIWLYLHLPPSTAESGHHDLRRQNLGMGLVTREGVPSLHSQPI